ncbi:hypothetical protein C8Q75DRAFT_292448 [Abortiporus biennis]|nr:hypothetical protein C8Q75DRAFT_292448 [Abortiporus biennis]
MLAEVLSGGSYWGSLYRMHHLAKVEMDKGTYCVSARCVASFRMHEMLKRGRSQNQKNITRCNLDLLRLTSFLPSNMHIHSLASYDDRASKLKFDKPPQIRE